MSFLLVILLAACGGDTPVDDAPQAEAPARGKGKAKAKARGRDGKARRPAGRPVTLAGVLGFQEQAITLRPCQGDSQAVVLRDAEGRVSRAREELGAQGGDLFVQVRGLRQDDGSVVLKAVDAAVAGEGCPTPPDGLAVWGGTPAWRLEVAQGAASLERPEQLAVTFAEVERAEDRKPVFRLSGGDGAEAVLTLDRTRCRDAAASAFYPWTATLAVDGETLSGCAWGTPPRTRRAAVGTRTLRGADQADEE